MCQNGRCVKPDCDADEPVRQEGFGVNLLEGLAKDWTQAMSKSPWLNIQVDDIRTSQYVETGEECCGCLDPEDGPQPYKTIGGRVKAGITATGGVPAFSVVQTLPEKRFTFGSVEGFVELGAVGRGTFAVGGQYTHKTSGCDTEEQCSKFSVTGGGTAFVGITATAELQVSACSLINKESCRSILALSARNNLGASVGVDFIGVKSVCGDSCTKTVFGEVKGVGEIEYEIIIGSVYETSYSANINKVIYEGIVVGDGQCSI